MTRAPLLALLLAACAPAPEPVVDEAAVPLSPRRQLIRLSLDLRGVPPSAADLAAIEADPSLYPAFVDHYLDDPRFGDTVEEWFERHYRTQTGESYFSAEEAGLDPSLERALVRSLNAEPLRLVRHVAENDLPWTEIVLADYAIADPLTAWAWDMALLEGAPGPQRARYRDGRPHAGVLSSTTLWQRYPSAGLNGNRHRANETSRILLCEDYLARPVSFARAEVDSVVGGDPETIIRDTPICQSCHASLDPLAAHFFGFWWEIDGGIEAQTTYRPEDEGLWREYAGKSPAYYGVATTGLREMAEHLAADPRFVTCAVEQVFEALTQRDATALDRAELRRHEIAFEGGGLALRELVRSIANSPEYVAAEFTDERAERVPTVKTASPRQLAGVIAARTGYRWTFGGEEALLTGDRGLPVLAGGTDSRFVVTPNHDPSVGLAFVHERLAQAAAWHVARHDLAPGREGAPLLLELVGPDDVPETSPDAFEAQIRALYLEITGEALPPEAPEPAALVALYKQLRAVEDDPVAAWAGVISVVLRDPSVILY